MAGMLDFPGLSSSGKALAIPVDTIFVAAKSDLDVIELKPDETRLSNFGLDRIQSAGSNNDAKCVGISDRNEG